MPYTISLKPGEQQFEAEENESILEAALRAGLILPYGCRDGACGACKADVVSGRVEHGVISDLALPQADQTQGKALLCQARALSDLTIRTRTAERAADTPVKKLPCRVQSLKQVATDVMILTVRLPARQTFRFHPGQYVDLLLEGKRRRSFSIANSPAHRDHLELHVRRINGGYFTPQVFERTQRKDILRLEGPLGTFGLQHDSKAPVVLIAGGTGFAPIKSIIEDLIERGGSEREILLYWGARQREGLYMDELARRWESALADFHFIPVLSEPRPTDNWNGRTGLVHRAVMSDLPDLSAHEVYACGSPAMIDAARADLIEHCKLKPDTFFVDAFTFAKDPPN